MLFIFDMGGVVTNSAAVEKGICEQLGITEKDFFTFCGCSEGNASYGAGDNQKKMNLYSSDLMTLLSNGTITIKQFWNEFSARSGKAIQTDWWSVLFHPQKNRQTIALIEELKKKYRVVCGTNTIESHYLSHIARGDYSLFDQTYASCVMGVSKPDIRFWKIILAAENIAAEETIFIDDSNINCSVAASIGITALHFTGAENISKEIKKYL